LKWLKTWKITSQHLDAEYSAFHIHEYCEILYVQKGKVRINTADKTYILNSGEMTIFAPMEQHSVVLLESPYERIGMHIDCDLLQQKGIGPVLMSALNHYPEERNGVIELTDNSKLSGLLEQINEEAKSIFPKSEEMTEVLFHHFLLQLYRNRPDCFRTSAGDKLMDEAKKYIESNIDNLPQISRIAGMYYLTPSHFISRFKNHTGYTPKKYCNLLRMAKARCLLKETELSLSEIAEKCGFSDLNGFVRTFRQSTGISPGKFRTIDDLQ